MDNIIGKRIRELRKKSDYKTQEDLAKALRDKYGLKTDRPMVSKWEIGYQRPEMYTIKCLASLFGVSIEYLTDEKQKPIASRDELIYEFDPKIKEIMYRLNKASPEIRKIALEQLDLLLGLEPSEDKK